MRETSTWARGCVSTELLDDGKQDVHGGFVGPDEHPSPAQVLELADGAFGLFLEPGQPSGVVQEYRAGLGELSALRGPVEEPLAQLVLETLHGLADRRLGPVQLCGRTGEAPFGRDGEKDVQLGEVHRIDMI